MPDTTLTEQTYEFSINVGTPQVQIVMMTLAQCRVWLNEQKRIAREKFAADCAASGLRNPFAA